MRKKPCIMKNTMITFVVNVLQLMTQGTRAGDAMTLHRQSQIIRWEKSVNFGAIFFIGAKIYSLHDTDSPEGAK